MRPRNMRAHAPRARPRASRGKGSLAGPVSISEKKIKPYLTLRRRWHGHLAAARSSPAPAQALANVCCGHCRLPCLSWGRLVSERQLPSCLPRDICHTPTAGLACEGSTVLGVVVLTLENEEDDATSWSEYSRRVGCGPTILSMMYDHVLEEPLQARMAQQHCAGCLDKVLAALQL